MNSIEKFGIPSQPTVPPMPPSRSTREQICEICAKEDVCSIKEELMRAYSDILDIEGRTNVFINTTVSCKKFLYKVGSNGVR